MAHMVVHYKKVILLSVAVMYALPTYTMNSKPDKNNEKLFSPFFYATANHTDLLKDMLAYKKVDPNIHDADGDTLLHLAAASNQSEYVPILLGAGANPNMRNNNGNSPLHSAALHSQCKSIQLLLNNKANPNLTNNYSETPLHYTINPFVNVQIVALLLSAKANPNLKNIHGNVPIHNAVLQPIPKLIKATQLLLQHGAQVDTVNNSGSTPLQLVIRDYHSPIAQKMGRLLVWYQYIFLPHFTNLVPAIIPEKEIAWVIASHLALLCAEQPTIWS